MFLVIWLICGAICAIVAGAKGRSAVGWFVLGLIFPLLAVIIVLVIGDARPRVIVIQNGVPTPAVDMRQWSHRDRQTYLENKSPPASPPAPSGSNARNGAILFLTASAAVFAIVVLIVLATRGIWDTAPPTPRTALPATSMEAEAEAVPPPPVIAKVEIVPKAAPAKPKPAPVPAGDLGL